MRVRVDIVPEYRDLLAACGLDRAETLLRRPADESLVARHGKRCTEVVHPDGEDGRARRLVRRAKTIRRRRARRRALKVYQ